MWSTRSTDAHTKAFAQVTEKFCNRKKYVINKYVRLGKVAINLHKMQRFQSFSIRKFSNFIEF